MVLMRTANSSEPMGSRIMTNYVHPELLAETAWLADHLDNRDIRIVDARWPSTDRGGRAAYLEGHLPGAVYIDVTRDIADPDDPIAVQIAPRKRFADAMSRAGIGNDTLVVAYDDAGGTVAARFWWALLYYGHTKAKILNGGVRRWKAEQRPLTIEEPSYPRADFVPASPRRELRSTLEDVEAARRNGEALILDARIQPQFRGEQSGGMPRAGHIPGSVNVPFTNTFARGTQTLLSAHELAALYQRAGALGPRVITTCGAGVAAAGAMFCLRLLGYTNVSVYDGSWDEWSRHLELPVATGG